MTDRTPSSLRRTIGLIVATAVGVFVFTILARLAGAPAGTVSAGVVVVVVVAGVVAIGLAPRLSRHEER